MTNQIKVCKCCGTRAHSHRQRVCRTCKVPANWEIKELTSEERQAEIELKARLEDTLKSLIT